MFTLLLSACNRAPRQHASTQPASCESRAKGSRWATAGAYQQTTVIGRRENDWFHEVGGVAVYDSLVFVYDAPESQITVLTEALAPVRTFGRRGGGPGEMTSFTSMGLLGPQWQWLAMAGDTLTVFDGIAVHRFSLDGRFIGREYNRAVKRIDLNDGSPIVARVDGALLSSWGGYHLSILREPSDRWRWSILRHTSGRPDSVISLQLKPLPTGRQGVPFTGPEQAEPVWGWSRDCVVATDGSGGWLVRAELDGPGLDTVTFELPDVELPKVDKEEIARMSGMASKGRAGYLEPSALMRVSSLVVDPDGYAWILPAQEWPRGAQAQIVRVSLATGKAEFDTVPAFPIAFGRPGVFYARTNSTINGVAEVGRYEAKPATMSRQAPLPGIRE
ncbi:hypothetical protein [Longimicrobium sp.]|uniref:hypothetical protein n=1 Tax=Longimicrobium sp. TaxID=2029185 RepID=UPI002E32846A|nr:hypothetical protein [Longimicrobium sp.]HEX6040549.1 hypothetical protein [Longimicrobium sp.]